MPESLFQRLGGEAAVEAAVDIFYRRVLSDSSISRYFEDVDMDAQRAKQKAFLTMVFGGPRSYTGKDLRAAHERLVKDGLTDAHFDAVVRHLEASLQELNVPAPLVTAVVAIADSTRSDVLGR